MVDASLTRRPTRKESMEDSFFPGSDSSAADDTGEDSAAEDAESTAREGWQYRGGVSVRDTICQLIALALVGATWFVGKRTLECYAARYEADPIPHDLGRKPSLPDLGWAGLFAVLISVFRHYSSVHVWAPWAKHRLGQALKDRPSRKWTVEERNEKEAKWETAAFITFYMTCASLSGWLVLKDMEWFPSHLGGKGGWGLAEPQEKAELTEGQRWYFLVEMGFALHSLGHHLVAGTKRANDYWEMLVHHMATLILEVVSYFSGCFRLGMLVLFVHDVPDIFKHSVKMAVDGWSERTLVCNYFALMAAWGYFRLWVFPWDMIEQAIGDNMLNSDLFNGACGVTASYFLVVMLCLLLALHWWWYYIFVVCFIKYSRTLMAADDKLGVKRDAVLRDATAHPLGKAHISGRKEA